MMASQSVPVTGRGAAFCNDCRWQQTVSDYSKQRVAVVKTTWNECRHCQPSAADGSNLVGQVENDTWVVGSVWNYDVTWQQFGWRQSYLPADCSAATLPKYQSIDTEPITDDSPNHCMMCWTTVDYCQCTAQL